MRTLDFSPWGGAYNRTDPTATAFAHRSARFLLKHEIADSPQRSAAARRWLIDSWSVTHPWGTGGVHPNFPDPDLDAWAPAYHGPNLDRLRRVKATYDPDGVFGRKDLASLPHPEASGTVGTPRDVAKRPNCHQRGDWVIRRKLAYYCPAAASRPEHRIVLVIGRASERSLIEALLENARAGRSGALVLTGEPGVGKSVLLDNAVDIANGMRVLRTSGVETEVDLAFAGLHQLVRSVLHLTERLPAIQADALRRAIGLAGHDGTDRMLVAAATLSLLSEAAEDRPVLCVVEDAHWLDLPSAETLAFAVRRLNAEGVAVLVATRDRSWPAVRELPIAGFGREDAAALLREHAADLAPRVLDRLVDETGGIPLALVELAGALTPAQLAGRQELPHALPLGGRLQEMFLGQVRRLPLDSQRLLLVAAADDTGDAAIVLLAAKSLGLDEQALEMVELAGLVRIDAEGHLTFRHPLVRAAVYQGATFAARLAAHQALADALDGHEHEDRRAWHLAAAAIGPDDSVARDLERSARLAAQRGGYAVAAAAYERAADLSVAGTDKARHLFAAAQAADQAGLGNRAAALADRSALMITDTKMSAELTCLRGRIELARGSTMAAHALLVAGATRLAEHDPHAAAAALIEAVKAAWNMNDAVRVTDTTGRLAAVQVPADDPLALLASASVGFGDLLAGRVTEAVAQVRRELDAWLLHAPITLGSSPDPKLLQAWLSMAGNARVIADDALIRSLAESTVTHCRRYGLAAHLPWALLQLAVSEAAAGQHSAALVNVTEGLRLARDFGQHLVAGGCMATQAWVAAVGGEEKRCRQLAAQALEVAENHQAMPVAVHATYALALLELSLGRPETAVDRLRDPRGPLLNPLDRLLAIPDLIESVARAGHDDDLTEEITAYEEWAVATGQPWAEASALRCRALLADDDAETYYKQALAQYERIGPQDRMFDRARTELLFGEWLRRTRRRSDARTQLTAAYEIFERIGANPWADRAASELRASGTTIRRREGAKVRLTPQEIQVVRLVAEGGSNQDVAAQMFLSPRTVAYHLYNAFPKLGISSRSELAGLDLDGLVATQSRDEPGEPAGTAS